MTTYDIPNGVGYSVPDSHRTYTPPPPPPSFTAPAVMARASDTEGTATEVAYAAILHARDEFEKHVEATHADRHLYTDDGFNDQISQFQQTEAAKAAAKAVDTIQARITQAEAKVDKEHRQLVKPGDAAQESRNSRYWDRVVRLLDAADNSRLTALSDEIIAAASPTELGVLIEELGPYMRAKAERIAAPNTRTSILDGYTTAIEHAVTQAVPSYATAKAELKKAQEAAQFINAAAKALHNGLAAGRAPARHVLAAFNPPSKYDPDK